ncbi:hypothetical protein WICMUC_000507 [Wickerhamomyces mucosus]|uniref:Uncharacterized protein n=1 Tax=Wickerhamomyces mucosus TaxID=1378264 RepID=A0A9P8TIY9_9ASCO|nr:hypothetical protein WICMUC_000507 [Wickerhamomyces mucosus]
MANPISVSKTTKKADLNSTLQKLNAITEIASKYSNKRSKYIFDLASVDDPFNRQHLLKKIDPKDREALSKLITSFEESLDRVLVS